MQAIYAGEKKRETSEDEQAGASEKICSNTKIISKAILALNQLRFSSERDALMLQFNIYG